MNLYEELSAEHAAALVRISELEQDVRRLRAALEVEQREHSELIEKAKTIEPQCNGQIVHHEYTPCPRCDR